MPDGQPQPVPSLTQRAVRSTGFALGIGLLVGLVSVSLWKALADQARTFVSDSLVNAAAARQKFIRLELDDYTHDLARSAALWEAHGLPLSPTLEQNARLYLVQYPAVENLAWVDIHHHVQWQLFPSAPEWTRTLNDPPVSAVLDDARDHHVSLFTPDLAAFQASLVVVPLFPRGQFGGYLVAVLNTRQMLATLLQTLSTRYQCRISEGDRCLFQSSAGTASSGGDWRKDSSLDVAGLHWTIEVWPEPKQLSDTRSHLPEVVLAAGLGLAVMISLSIYLRQQSARQARQLGHINQTLETEIRERRVLDEALQQARREAEAASAAKGRFLASMSHEIRTPMNAILGWTELALDTSLAAEQRAWLEMVRDSGVGLLSILDDCLDVSKIEAGQLELEEAPFALRSTLRRAVSLMSVRASERNLDLVYRIPAQVPDALLGDAARLRQILLNLVSNAIKFTEQGGVYIDVSVSDPGAAEVELQFAVRDTGIGIPTDRLQAIFSPFTQGDDSTTRRFGGTGLGLTICSQLAEKMGGKLSVQSTPGAGSTFFCSVRVRTQPDDTATYSDVSEHLGLSNRPPQSPGTAPPLRPGPAPQPPCGDEPSKTGPSILLAEDNPVNQRLAVQILRQHGYQVHVVQNGREAVEAFRRSSFDVVLMDLEMPELDGLGATAEIRRHEAEVGGHVPIIAVTAHALSGVRQVCHEAGMDGYLTKPFKRLDLISLLGRLLSPGRSVVDWAAALQGVDGSEPLLTELCQLFVQDAPPLLVEAADEAAHASLAGLVKAVHRLGGMMALFVAPDVRELARHLEASAKNEDMAAVAVAWPQFHDVVERMVAEVRARGAQVP